MYYICNDNLDKTRYFRQILLPEISDDFIDQKLKTPNPLMFFHNKLAIKYKLAKTTSSKKEIVFVVICVSKA